MSWYIHRLDGCAPTPLARYLKALGILRTVAEQKDAGARGFWKHGAFHLATRLTLDELVAFFADEWAPTPIVTPWNADGGFIGDKHEPQTVAQNLGARGPRFKAWVDGVAAAAASVAGLTDSPKDEDKLAVFAAARGNWDEAGLAWLDAVVTLLPGADKPKYPALLASGGCDGRFDFGAAYRKRLALFFGEGKGAPTPVTLASWVRAALTGGVLPKLAGESGGQLDPGSTSPVNGGSGFRGDSAVNPWDFVFAFEGIPVVRVAVGRKLMSDAVLASAPFAVRGSSSGYASASASDEAGRGEQWMPIWTRAATLDEVGRLFAEGRMLTGDKLATNALDAAKAIARLGVARGIEAFERFGYVPRNGQSSLAVPLGRWPVQSNPRVRLLDEIEVWVDRLRRASGDKGAPAALGRDVRQIESAMLEVCRAGGDPERWQDVLVSLGAAESHLVARSKFTKEHYLQPLPQLSIEWLEAAADQSVELRIAAAIALQDVPAGSSDAVRAVLGPMRMHALPLDGSKRWTRFATGEGGLAKDPRVVWSGGDLARDLAAVVMRRVLEGDRAGTAGLALAGPLWAGLGDIERFLCGETDDARIAGLARGLMALAPPAPGQLAGLREKLGGGGGAPSALHALARLTHLSSDLPTIKARTDPAIARLLVAGRLDEAMTASLRRLRAGGLAPRLRFATGASQLALRLAATIAIPVAPHALERLLACITKPVADQLRADIS